MTQFTDLEHVFLIVGISRPMPARFIGYSKGKHLFEALRQDFGQYKNGSQLVFVKYFDIADLQIEGKKVIVIK